MINRFLIFLLAILPLAAVHAAIAPIASNTGSAERIKAAYLYNFAHFVTWPAGARHASQDTLRICTIGAQGLGGALESIVGKTAQGRILQVEHLAPSNDVGDCQILYVGAKANLHEVLNKCGADQILTVGESEHFTRLGGMIRLRLDEDSDRLEGNVSIGIDINTSAARRSHLKISSRLLKVARLVND